MGPITKKKPAESFSVAKWSSKPAEHGLARARINQRRHRERVKCHIETLESSLAQAQRDLGTANAKIEDLTAELEAARSANFVDRTIPPTGSRMTGSGDAWIALHQVTLAPPLSGGPDILGIDSEPKPYSVVRLPQSSPLLSDSSAHKPEGTYDIVMEQEEKDCYILQPPNNDESTTLCRDACDIVMAQNYAGLDTAALLSWLRPGFRGATEKGGGCRVNNSILLALLDHIS